MITLSGARDELNALKVYYAVNVILFPGSFSLTTIATLQQMSFKLQRTFGKLMYDGKMFKDTINLAKKIYDSLEVHNQAQEGTVPYPRANATREGMAIQIRCGSSTSDILACI